MTKTKRKSEQEKETKEFVLFKLNESLCGLDIDNIQEIVLESEVNIQIREGIKSRYNNSQQIEGMFLLREEKFLLLNPQKKLLMDTNSLEEQKKDEKEKNKKKVRKILLLRDLDNTINKVSTKSIGLAVLCDDVESIEKIDKNQIESVGNITNKNYIDGVAKKDDNLIIVFNRQLFRQKNKEAKNDEN